jgi:hypothetical protein
VNFADKVYIIFKQLLGSSGATIVGVYTDVEKANEEKHLQSAHSKAYNFTIVESKISA